MTQALLMIAANDAQQACRGEPDVKKRLRKAMAATKNHWMATDWQVQFKAALAGAMLESPPDEKALIQRLFDQMAKLSALLTALQAGVPVDIEAMAADKPQDDILPLQQLWHEAGTEERPNG